MEEFWVISLKLITAFILGGMIGIDRSYRQKPAGSRTISLICLGSTLMMIISLDLSELYSDRVADPGRIAAQVVTGIGFLGAGAIIRARGAVHGLTTAATIWVVAGIGLAIGAGFYGAAVVTTVLVIFVLRIFLKIESHFHDTSIPDDTE